MGGHCSYRAGEKVTESVRGPKGPLCLGHRETEVRKRKREPHFSGCRLERDGGQEAGRGAYRDREAGVGDRSGGFLSIREAKALKKKPTAWSFIQQIFVRH